MVAILFMQIRWSLFIYEFFEPLAALEMLAFSQMMSLCTTKALY